MPSSLKVHYRNCRDDPEKLLTPFFWRKILFIIIAKAKSSSGQMSVLRSGAACGAAHLPAASRSSRAQKVHQMAAAVIELVTLMFVGCILMI